MRRRALLATGLAGIAALSAGCANPLARTVTLSDPEIGVRSDGLSKYRRYTHDGERVVTLGVEQRSVPASTTDRFGFRVSVPHSRDTIIESFRFDLRAPRSSVQPPADVYLESPGTDLPSGFTFEDVDAGWTRIALDDAGAFGESTVTLDTIVDPNSVPAEEVALRASLTLASETRSRRYRVETSTQWDVQIE